MAENSSSAPPSPSTPRPHWVPEDLEITPANFKQLKEAAMKEANWFQNRLEGLGAGWAFNLTQPEKEVLSFYLAVRAITDAAAS